MQKLKSINLQVYIMFIAIVIIMTFSHWQLTVPI